MSKEQIERKTSAEWYVDEKDLSIIDPDGWRSLEREFYYHWYLEKITQEEFNKRLWECTCMIKGE